MKYKKVLCECRTYFQVGGFSVCVSSTLFLPESLCGYLVRSPTITFSSTPRKLLDPINYMGVSGVYRKCTTYSPNGPWISPGSASPGVLALSEISEIRYILFFSRLPFGCCCPVISYVGYQTIPPTWSIGNACYCARGTHGINPW